MQDALIREILPLVTLPEGAILVSNMTILFIIVLVLLLFTAIISGAETAFFSLSAKDIEYLKVRDKNNTRQVIGLLEQPKILLVNMLVSTVILNISIMAATSFLVKQIIDNSIHPTLLVIIQIGVITFLLVLFGSILPKVYATQNNMRMVLFAAPVLKIVSSIFSPVSKMLISSSNYMEERLNVGDATPVLSSEELEETIERSVGHPATKEEVDIFKRILKFDNITVRQIMRTRLDVSALPYDYSLAQVEKYVTRVGYSRMPVYKGSLDTVVGILNTKDLSMSEQSSGVDWHTLVRPAHFVPENKQIKDLRKELQQNRIHFAIVVDEFGGTSGIVTLEDIIEEIVGDIKDEFDEDDLHYKKVDEDNYFFEGKTLINDVCRVIGESADVFDEVRGESDSLAGLLLEIAGKFPALNETITYKNFNFVVLEIDKMRIKRVKVTIDREEEN